MLKKWVLILTSLLFLGISEHAFAQDPEFTQFYANPIYLNPAFAGTARCPRINLNYRNQWPNLIKTYITYSASYDQHVDGISGGLGLLAFTDKAGDGVLNTTNISGIYSYQLNINRELSMKFGVQGTYFQKSLDWSKLTFGDMIDERYGFIYTGQESQKIREVKSGFDVSAGMLAYSKRYFGGIAVHHLNRPDEGFIGTGRLPMKLTLHAGAMLPIGDKSDETSISPNVLYQRQQDIQQLNLGLYIMKGSIVGGLWYRNQDAFIALIGFQQHFFKIGYSYDITVSRLANATAGSHEISFSLQFECKPKKKKFRTVSCPSF